MKKVFIVIAGLAGAYILFLILINVTQYNNTVMLRVTGIEGLEREQDIVFHGGSDGVFYINRGLERNLNIDTLKRILLHKDITLEYRDNLLHLPPLHINKILYSNKAIFDENAK
jgi:hypothetical protein